MPAAASHVTHQRRPQRTRIVVLHVTKPIPAQGLPHLVALLRVWRALGHDHQAGTGHAARHSRDVVALLPLLLHTHNTE